MKQKLENLAIMTLGIIGKNYLSWRLEAETYLDAHGLGDTIQAGKVTTSMQKAKALMFIRHHLHVDLKTEYLTVKDPLVLWNKLKDKFDHQKTVIFPKAGYEWTHLRLQDFKSVSEHNSAMHRITSTLLFCGDTITDAKMLEKTFSTFHASNIILQQQYRAKVEVEVADMAMDEDVDEAMVVFKKTNGYKKWQDKKKNEKDGDEKEKGVTADLCYRYGSFDHWAKHCRTPKHLVALYQEYIKNKENGVESNFVYHDRDDIPDDPIDQTDATHLDDNEFLTNE
ncbi:hypothetical protein Tco_0393340 [Tanacetum coccineum]